MQCKFSYYFVNSNDMLIIEVAYHLITTVTWRATVVRVMY